MIYTGVDIVHIPRLKNWPQYPPERLATFFGASEIAYAGAHPGKAVTFLASRFAVKEAFYKALCSLCADLGHKHHFSIRASARWVEITHDPAWKNPILLFNRIAFEAATGIQLPLFSAQVSISHEKEYAMASVLMMRA